MYKPQAGPGERAIHRLNHLRAIYRLIIGLTASVLFSIVILRFRMEVLTRVMVGWDVYCFVVLLLNAISFQTMKADQIRVLAKRQDASRPVVFLLVVVACVTSLVAVMDLLSNKSHWILGRKEEAIIYLLGVAGSWMLMHTIFTLRYAHTYYGDHPSDPDHPAGGLEIPGDTRPDYMDFAYFSFVIGMTFQVSDISITSPKIRQIALLHGLLSFLFNTVIVALTINEVVNLQP
jgi:uncharacterized membrane protein